MRKSFYLFMACAVVPLGSLLPSCSSPKPQQQAGAAPFAVSVCRVQRGNIAHTLSVAGQFQPYQLVEVHAKVSGYIRRIYVDIGDRVHAGQTLAVLEVPELNAQYRGTQSEERRSRDQIAQAQQEVARAQSLHSSLQANYDRLQQAAKAQPGLIAAQELDDARSQADAAQARIDGARAGLSAANQGAGTATADKERVGALQSYTTIIAPLNGVVIWRYADTGALIQSGTASDTQSMPLIKLSESNLLRLRVPVSEDAIEYIHKGDPIQVRVDALNRSFTGKVARFTRDISLDTRTMQTEVDVPNGDLSITPGMYANTYVQTAHRDNVLTVPVAAVQGDGPTGSVTVLDADNRLQQRMVQVGLRGSFLVEVVSGLNEGDRVVLGTPTGYKPGERVTARMQREPTNDVMHEEGGMFDPQDPADTSTNQTGGGSK